MDLLDGRELNRLYRRSRGRHGLKSLKAPVALLNGSAPWTQSELERRFLAMIRGARPPEPQQRLENEPGQLLADVSAATAAAAA